jgi:hypothetical protein
MPAQVMGVMGGCHVERVRSRTTRLLGGGRNEIAPDCFRVVNYSMSARRELKQ